MSEKMWRRAVAVTIAWACVMGGGIDAARAADAIAPIVPGYVRLKDEAKAPPAELGQVLLGELNCVQCHAAAGQQRIFTKGAPDLTQAGARMTPQYIKKYILDNHGMKPGTTMPDLFHASDPQAKEAVADFLTHFLVSKGGPMKPSGEEVNILAADQGRKLFHQVGCVACHAPEKNPNTTIPSIPLPNLAEKTTVENLEAFLLDPAKVRPGGRMPSLNLTREEAHAIAIYLLRDQLDNPLSKTAEPAKSPGPKFIYYELSSVNTCALEKIEPLRPKYQGRIDRFSLDIPKRRNDKFAIKFSGTLRVPKDGKYKFFTSSDDGSRLYLNGKLVVDNDGVHPVNEKSAEINLIEGDLPIIVTYFQQAADAVLKVQWEGPGFTKREIAGDAVYSVGGRPMIPLNNEPFVLDPDKARMGTMMFGAIGCAACHAIPGTQVMKVRKAMAELDPESATGCLGDQIPKTVPNYHLSADQKAALKAALKNAKELDTPLEPKQVVTHTAAAFNCYACHVRDNAGGPTADRVPLFVMSAAFDMGDEGKIPPRLTNVGAKLTPEALEQVIFENKLHVRPVLATRMPTFNKAKVGGIVEALAAADEGMKGAAPKFDQPSAKDGRTLFGTKGMGCVNCHGINGVKSLGMPAPDMGTAHERLRYGWYHELMLNPAHVNPGTRMPAFWTNGDVAFKNIAGGTVDGQLGAIWNYLSLGTSMPMPSGLQPSGGDELVPADGPIVHRTFFKDAGNRSIAVGFPEMVHVVFDADVVRLAFAWKGRFFDAKGMWEGRGGAHLGPLGTDVISLPPGPSFAVLASPDAAWPTVTPVNKGHGKEATWIETDRNIGGHFKGYVLDKEDRPIFHYVLNDIDIQEQPLPVLKTGGADLQRKFQLSSKQSVKGLYFLAAQGQEIEPKSAGEWLVTMVKGTATAKVSLRLSDKSVGTGKPIIRDSGGVKQLLIPISFDAGTASFNVEMSW